MRVKNGISLNASRRTKNLRKVSFSGLLVSARLLGLTGPFGLASNDSALEGYGIVCGTMHNKNNFPCHPLILNHLSLFDAFRRLRLENSIFLFTTTVDSSRGKIDSFRFVRRFRRENWECDE